MVTKSHTIFVTRVGLHRLFSGNRAFIMREGDAFQIRHDRHLFPYSPVKATRVRRWECKRIAALFPNVLA